MNYEDQVLAAVNSIKDALRDRFSYEEGLDAMLSILCELAVNKNIEEGGLLSGFDKIVEVLEMNKNGDFDESEGDRINILLYSHRNDGGVH